MFLVILTTISLGTAWSGDTGYPNKPIQILIGMAPGGSLDMLTRTLAQEAKKYLGQEIVIINKVGATGSVAAAQVAMAKPDGYTLGGSASSTFTVTPFIQDISIDLVKESAPILSFSKVDNVIFVKPDSPVKGLKDFIEYARRNPGKATYGTPGVGTRSNLAMAAIAAHEGIKINHVPFPGDSPVATAVLGGHIMVGICSPAAWISQLEARTLRPLAVIGEDRVDLFPDIPTIVELGYPYPLPIVHFFHGPKGLPEPIVKKLADAFEKASQSATFRDLTTKNVLFTKKHMMGKELATFLATEKAKTGVLIQKLGLGKK